MYYRIKRNESAAKTAYFHRKTCFRSPKRQFRFRNIDLFLPMGYDKHIKNEEMIEIIFLSM